MEKKSKISKRISALYEKHHNIYCYLKRSLSSRRFIHSQNVAELCVELCERFSYNPEKGFLAGLCHDICREWTEKRIMALVKEDGETINTWENPVILHARAGAVLVRNEFRIEAEDILQAIKDHVLGRAGMGLLSNLLYVADYMEPGRGFIDRNEREETLRGSLTNMMLYVTRSIINYLEGHGRTPAAPTRELLLELTNKLKRR